MDLTVQARDTGAGNGIHPHPEELPGRNSCRFSGTPGLAKKLSAARERRYKASIRGEAAYSSAICGNREVHPLHRCFGSTARDRRRAIGPNISKPTVPTTCPLSLRTQKWRRCSGVISSWDNPQRLTNCRTQGSSTGEAGSRPMRIDLI